MAVHGIVDKLLSDLVVCETIHSNWAVHLNIHKLLSHSAAPETIGLNNILFHLTFKQLYILHEYSAGSDSKRKLISKSYPDVHETIHKLFQTLL